MKISKDNLYDVNNEFDFMTMINEFQDKYGDVYWNNIEGQMFVYRPLGRMEYKQILSADIADIEKEDVVCEACLLYPENFDFDSCIAGVPTTLFNIILSNSFLDSITSKKSIINYSRAEMEQFDNQITCIINEAFPNFDIEEIENWDMAKTAKYLSRAEWKLNVLRNIPIDHDISNKLMEQEWSIQHDTNNNSKEEVVNNKETQQNLNQSQSQKNSSDTEFKVETLEERQERLKNEGPRKKTPEEMERLKRQFPEIKWDFEVDPSKDISAMEETIDSRPVALRY